MIRPPLVKSDIEAHCSLARRGFESRVCRRVYCMAVTSLCSPPNSEQRRRLQAKTFAQDGIDRPAETHCKNLALAFLAPRTRRYRCA
jgi:hypothetical protein